MNFQKKGPHFNGSLMNFTITFRQSHTSNFFAVKNSSSKNHLKHKSFRVAFKLINLFLFLFLTSACTTDPATQFSQIKIGMEKDQVIGLMESPQRTLRWKGKDRWTYIFYKDQIRNEKEVEFLEGFVTYVGDIQKPIISAEEKDLRNHQSNAELEKYYQNQMKNSSQNTFQKYEDQTKGTNEIRYVPQFKPIE